MAGLLLASAASASSIILQTVPVGNAPDARATASDGTTGDSSVNYAYNIGQYEMAAGQYATLLKAVARTDAYGLYNPNIPNTSYGSGITRTGTTDSYKCRFGAD